MTARRVSPSSSRWRSMGTAPKDGTYILLAYPSFSDNGQVFVGHALWVDVPPETEFSTQLREIPHHRVVMPTPPYRPHWEIAYVTVLEHCGTWNGRTYEARNAPIRNPLGWMPVPEASASMKRRAQQS